MKTNRNSLITLSEFQAHVKNRKEHGGYKGASSGGEYPFEVGKAFLFCFKLVDVTDFASPETGKSPTVTISINGGAFGALTGSPAVSEISNGWYSVTVPASDMVSGVVVLKAIAAGTAQEDFVIYMA